MSSEAEMLLSFFDYLTKARIPYCVVGAGEHLPSVIRGDVDLVVYPDELLKMPKHLGTFCEANGAKLVQCLQHEQTAFYFVISWQRGNLNEFLAIDICSDYFRDGRLLLQAHDILKDRRLATDRCGKPKGFFVPKPAAEFRYYLLKKVDKASLHEEQAGRLSVAWQQSANEAQAAIAPFFTPALLALIARAAKEHDWSEISRRLPELRRSLRKNLGHQRIADWHGELRRRWRRFALPTGLVVAFLGQDGSGKSTVIREVTAAVGPAFRRTLQFHLFPKQRGSQFRAEVVDPHGLPPRSTLESAVKLLYFLLLYHFGWWRRVRPALVRSTFVSFDRYFHDILLDGLRYRFRRPRWLAQLVARAIPQPDLWIVLDAPVEVLRSRKVELSAAACARLRERYVAFARGRPNALLVDASRPLPEVTATVARGILSALSTRTRKRLGIRR